MDNRHDDISASDLLAKLKANMAETAVSPSERQEKNTDTADTRKKYKFRRSGKSTSVVTEEEIRSEMPEQTDEGFLSPIPKSDIEDLDIDALMKKYLPEEDYAKMASRSMEVDEEEDELVRTLTSMDLVKDENTANEKTEEAVYWEDEPDTVYAAPDSELFAHLSEGGKVCDVPGEEEEDDKSDTRPAPLRPMSEEARTLAFGLPTDEEEEDTVFEPISLPMAIPNIEETIIISEPSQESESEENSETVEVSEADPADTLILPSTETTIFSLPTEKEDTEDIFASSEVSDSSDPDNNKEIAENTITDIEPISDIEENDHSTVEGDADFDETDANLMLAFGMDEELDRALGKESADKLRSDMDELLPNEEKPAKPKQEIHDTLREYISPAETKDIFDTYKVAYGKSALRLFGMLVVTILLFFYENLTALGGTLADALNPVFYPVVNVMVGLQILLIGFALCFKSFLNGVKGLMRKKPTPDSFLPILLGISVLYSVAVCFFPAGTVFVTFHFPASLCLLLTIINERLDLRREIMAFNIVSSKRTKFALEKLDIDEAELETRAFDKFLPQSPSIFKINKTSFVDGYFRRTKAYPTLKLVLTAFIPATLVALVVGMLVGVFHFRNWQQAVMLGYTVFSFSMPASIFLSFGLPAFKAAKIAFSENSAFVGEAALDEYTTAASISFDDREVFPTGGVKLRSIKVFGSGRIDTVIYNVASVYALLGGPLADVLNVATADLGHSEDTEILTIENEGVEAVVEERHLYIGKADYLRKHGYIPVADPDDEEIEGGGEISILFLVCDDEVIAKLYIRYRIDPEFEVTLKNLYRSGICVGIKTVDPNINDEMLSTRIRLSKYPVRVLKYSDVVESRRGSDRTDSGIVSKKSAKALLRTFTLCDRVKHVTRTNLVVNIITMVVGLILSLAIAVLGSITGIHSVYVALFQLFWLLPVYLMSRFMLM